MAEANIDIIITGGTIDKIYNELTGSLELTESNLNKLIAQARCKVKLNVHSLMLRDSLIMNDKDRMAISNLCEKIENDKIIIMHGTDTMSITAALIKSMKLDKSIVMFGAMIPYCLTNSDALFNFGAAVTAVQILPYGVYITMNGKVFESGNVVKNKELGEFQSLNV